MKHEVCLACFYYDAEQAPCAECRVWTGDIRDRLHLWKGINAYGTWEKNKEASLTDRSTSRMGEPSKK